MTQAIHAGEDVFESALMRLLDPSRTAAVSQSATKWLLERGARGARVGTTQAGGAQDGATRVTGQVHFVEVLSSTTVSLRWSDPLAGHMGEQVWRCVIARRRSSCALTGTPIRRGDRVYQPRGGGKKVPCNWDRMIHAAAIQALLNASSAGQ